MKNNVQLSKKFLLIALAALSFFCFAYMNLGAQSTPAQLNEGVAMTTANTSDAQPIAKNLLSVIWSLSPFNNN
ncbi:MAG: hypothetical protein RL757_2525 [Bacteroidota bacterium]|jgi:hypothetical protein